MLTARYSLTGPMISYSYLLKILIEASSQLADAKGLILELHN